MQISKIQNTQLNYLKRADFQRAGAKNNQAPIQNSINLLQCSPDRMLQVTFKGSAPESLYNTVDNILIDLDPIKGAWKKILKLIGTSHNKSEESQKRVNEYRGSCNKCLNKVLDTYKEAPDEIISALTRKHKDFENGGTFLHDAMCVIDSSTFDKLLGIFKGDTAKIKDAFSIQDAKGSTPLIYLAANKNEKTAIYEKLIDAFNDDHKGLIELLTIKDESPRIPLHCATFKITLPVFKKLLNAFDRDFNTFKEAFSTPNQFQDTPFNRLMYVTDCPNEIFEELYNAFGENKGFKEMLEAKAYKEFTPLGYLMHKINTQTLEKLLTMYKDDIEGLGTILKTKDGDNKTPLGRLENNPQKEEILKKLNEILNAA